ncbi:DinB family protein [Flectobacillus major]|uniref:DinB family protein n=1 Tax=Flectobacillus major TaxID=103 RepID=UPI000416EACF|nr:DinB family protein [Flectobacillus major]
MRQAEKNEYPQHKYFSRYIEYSDSQDVIEMLVKQKEEVFFLLKNLTEIQQSYRYAEGKWSIKELVGHITDTERIFSYRSLCIARGEKAPLPGFDENEYMAMSNFSEQSFESLLEQYRLVRESSIALYASMTEEIASRMGNANGFEVSARAYAWAIAGHEAHHISILKERYLS